MLLFKVDVFEAFLISKMTPYFEQIFAYMEDAVIVVGVRLTIARRNSPGYWGQLKAVYVDNAVIVDEG